MELKFLPNFSIPNVSTRFLISPFLHGKNSSCVILQEGSQSHIYLHRLDISHDLPTQHVYIWNNKKKNIIQKNKTARKSPISSLFFPNSIFWLLMLCCFFFSSSFHAGVVAPRQGIKSSENEDVNSILISPMFRLAKDTENETEGVQKIQIILTYSI